MADARNVLTPRFDLHRTQDCILLNRDNKYLFRIYPRQLKFQVDIIEPEVQEEYTAQLKKSNFNKKVYGIFGFIKLAQYSYLIVVEEASILGQVLKANVFKVEKLMFLPLSNDSSRLIPNEDQQFVNMINKIQAERAFYFSYDIDLTKNTQKIVEEALNQSKIRLDINSQNFMLMKHSFPNSVDYISQYAFNDNLLNEFQGLEYAPFKVPCIFGYVFISSPNFNRAKIDFVLISRKDCRRPGRRFVTRGLDREGNAANFVETEHLFVQYDTQQKLKVASYVQIRGSIPLLWTMKPNLKWSPPVVINPNFDDSRIAADLHFSETLKQYGPQYLVNLIDKKGSQKRIGDQFTKLHQTIKNKLLQYTWFDFHGECKKMKWENLSKLVDICKEELNNYGYFMAQLNHGLNDRERFYDPRNFIVLQSQKGTFRTNCMDCLDRTNVVQGVFSRYVAHHQLNKLDLIDIADKLGAFEKFPGPLEESFRHGWTNNADVLSYLYTGTPALKTDFTRTGKRTHQGALNDGINAVTRYYINNFTDGYYHDCLDIATLKLQPTSVLKPRGFVTPLKICILIVLIIVFFVKTQADQWFFDSTTWHSFMHLITVLLVIGIGAFAIMSNGPKFIDDSSRFV